MERVQLLSDLNKRIAGSAKPQAANAPFVFTLMQKCIEYQIPANLMERLNYTDLLHLVVEYDIRKVQDYFRKKEQARLEERGVEIQDLTPEQATSFLRRSN